MSERDDYTPSVEDVEWTYASAFSCGVHTRPPLMKDWDEGKARFDRMIAQVRREAAAEQREKDAQIVEGAVRNIGYLPGPGQTSTTNPNIVRLADIAAAIREQ